LREKDIVVAFLTLSLQILGIGGFTYFLAALIVGMLSMNAILGPGWLGQAFGIQGTGTFTETSPTLPDQIDLSADDFLFKN
jgi:hypothetical protein